MKIRKVKGSPEPNLTVGSSADEPVEYETVDVFKKFKEYLHEVEQEYHTVRKVVISGKLYRLLRENNELLKYSTPKKYEGNIRLFGVRVEHEEFGVDSVTDFLIYTDRKVLHSDMLDKKFLEDVGVEELIHETNQRVEDREE